MGLFGHEDKVELDSAERRRGRKERGRGGGRGNALTTDEIKFRRD